MAKNTVKFKGPKGKVNPAAVKAYNKMRYGRADGGTRTASGGVSAGK